MALWPLSSSLILHQRTSLVILMAKCLPKMRETRIQSLGREDPLEKEMATHSSILASLVAQRLKHLPAMQETLIWSLVREDPLEEEMATHSSILAWRIGWTKEPGGVQSTGSQRVTQLKRLSKYFLQSWLLLFHCSVMSDPMGYSTPGFPVFHHLQELAQTHVHCVGDASCRKEINYTKSTFWIKR